MEKIPERKSEKEPFLNLVALREQLLNQIDELEDQFDEKRKKEKISFSWFKEKEQLLIKNFIDFLLKQKEAFQSVFETENGSIYFVSKNGQSWRFKKEDDHYKEQPILNKILFLEPQEGSKFIDLKKKPLFEEYLVGSPKLANQPTPYVFKKSALTIGNIPLEVGINGFAPVVFEENESELKIIGTQKPNGDVEKYFASGIHNGHPISKIY